MMKVQERRRYKIDGISMEGRMEAVEMMMIDRAVLLLLLFGLLHWLNNAIDVIASVTELSDIQSLDRIVFGI